MQKERKGALDHIDKTLTSVNQDIICGFVSKFTTTTTTTTTYEFSVTFL